VAKYWGWRTVRARTPDRPRSIQRGPKCVHFGRVRYVCTADRPSLGAGLSVVLTRENLSLHKFLCGCADCPTGVDRPSACAKLDLGRECVFWAFELTDCLGF
jgi:hypothetical protein